MTTPVQALSGVPNACQLLPTVTTGGQPTAAHLAAFKAAGGVIKYTEYPDLSHDIWARVFAEPDLPEWLFAQRRTSSECDGSCRP